MFYRFKNSTKAKEEAERTVSAAQVRQAAMPKISQSQTEMTADEQESILRTDRKVYLHQQVLDLVNLAALEKMDRGSIGYELTPILRELLARERIALNAQEYNQLLEELLDEVLGLGPLEPLIKDHTVSDILVNGHAQVFVERFGTLERTGTKFKDNTHLIRIIQKIVSAVGRRVDEAQPWVDARLPDGSRVNAILPPCALGGPLLSIRKFSKVPLTIDRMIENGTLTQEMAELLYVIVRARLNVLVSGGTGSGKTTLLNALSAMISDKERIATIEDTAELQLQQEHVVRMETRHSNIEGMGEVSQRDLLRNALRMRPDRIVIGEVRGAEVLDMLQAMNTGHEGSMTTVHANSPRDALTRLEHMAAMTGISIPAPTLRSQIASAIHVVLQVQRLADGTRRLVSLQEIVGMEGNVVSMQEIFRFRRTGVSPEGKIEGQHIATGVRPRFAERVKEWGFSVPSLLDDDLPEESQE